MDTEHYGGLISVNSSETDYQLLGGVLDLPTPQFTFNDRRIEYNQAEVQKNSCTLHGALGSIGDQAGYEFSFDQRKEVYGLAVTAGLDPEVGWFLRNAGDLCRKYATKVIGKEILSFRVTVGSQEFFDALNKGYSVYFGYQGNSAYNKDFKDDADLDSVTFGALTYGHALRMVKSDDAFELVVDNYKGRKPNVYTVKKENIDDLVRNGVFFMTAYVFALKESFDARDLLQRIPLWGLKSWEKAVAKGVHGDTEDPFERIGDAQDENFWFKLGGLTKLEGNLNRIRRDVAADRLKLFD